MLTMNETITEELTKQLIDGLLEPSLIPGVKYVIERYSIKKEQSKKTPKDKVSKKEEYPKGIVDETNAHTSKLNTIVAIESTRYYDDEIIDIVASRYVDFLEGIYHFSSNGKAPYYLDHLGTQSTRSRDKVLFVKSDIRPFINRNLEKWLQNHANCKLSTSADDMVNKVVLILYVQGYNMCIMPYTLKKRDSVEPYELIPLGNNDHTRIKTLTKEMCTDLSAIKYNIGFAGGECTGLYSFSKEDICRLTEDIEKVYSRVHE